MGGFAWTEKDNDYLRDVAGSHTVEELASHLGRSAKAVRNQCAALGLHPVDRRSAGRTNRVEPGEVFGRLTVLEEVRTDRRWEARVRCSCPDATEKTVPIHHLRKGNVQSCGCLNREIASARMLAREAPKGADHPGFKHGLATKNGRHPHYNRWNSIMQRCYNPNDPAYESYGALGVIVAEEWHDVRVFVQAMEALGPCPEGYSLDRIDVFGNYGPGKVRWASPEEQAANRKLSHKARDEMAVRVTEVLRGRFPGHSQAWYVAFQERSVLAAAGVPDDDLPALPPQ